jgi:hypothetical protein
MFGNAALIEQLVFCVDVFFKKRFYFTVYVITDNCSMVCICHKQLQIPDPFLFGVCPHHDEVLLCNVPYRRRTAGRTDVWFMAVFRIRIRGSMPQTNGSGSYYFQDANKKPI